MYSSGEVVLDFVGEMDDIIVCRFRPRAVGALPSGCCRLCKSKLDIWFIISSVEECCSGSTPRLLRLMLKIVDVVDDAGIVEVPIGLDLDVDNVG